MIYWALPLFPIWINFHAGAIIGALLVLVFGACDAVEARWRPGLEVNERSSMTTTACHFGIAGTVALLTAVRLELDSAIEPDASAGFQVVADGAGAGLDTEMISG